MDTCHVQNARSVLTAKDCVTSVARLVTPTQIDKYCVAGCSAISFSATCTTELSTLGSLMKTGKLSTFCNGP